MRLEYARVARDGLLERLAAPLARQRDPLGERLQAHTVPAAHAPAQDKIDGAREQAREHERPRGKRREPAEEWHVHAALLVARRHAIPHDRDVLARAQQLPEAPGGAPA